LRLHTDDVATKRLKADEERFRANFDQSADVLPFHDRFARGGTCSWRGTGPGRDSVAYGWRGRVASPEWPHEGIDEAKVDELAGLSNTGDLRPAGARGDRVRPSLWRGFGTFCDETLGLDAGKVLRVVLEPGAERVEELQAAAEWLDLDPDPGTVEEIREGLAGAWAVVEGRGGG